MTDLAKIPFREVDWLPIDLDIERKEDGTILMRHRADLADVEPYLPAYLRRFAEDRPEAVFLGRRTSIGGDWRTITYGEARDMVDALTQALINLNLPKGRPLAILSGNSIEHALILLAAMQASIPVAPLSPNYALLSKDFGKLRGIVETLEPAAYFVQPAPLFDAALEALVPLDVPVIWVDAPPKREGSHAYSDMVRTVPTSDVSQALAAIDPQATAKFMFTSGSTGTPKGVMQSQSAIVSAAVTVLQTFNLTADRPSVRLDWAPWNHVFGFVNFCLSLLTGGQFYIDDGKPVEPLVAETIRNLRDFSPTYYANVPAGFAAVLPYLEEDEELAKTFFRQLEMFCYAGARLADDIGERLQKLAVKITGYRMPMMAGFGSTETGPTGAYVHWPTDMVGLIGLPHPGVKMKLLPLGEGRFEVRLKTVGIMLGYHKAPDLTEAAFDEEGFYRLGDAATFVDPDNPEAGLRFAGRIAEDFKLQTGTFVQATTLRADLLLCTAPFLQDLVVCGESETFIALLAWPNLAAARALTGNPELTLAQAAAHELVVAKVRDALREHNSINPVSSMRVKRFLLLDVPASIDGGEITDKGSVNAKTVVRRRADDLALLYKAELEGRVIEV
jgi:feruloyl-CoA synthase